MALNGIDPVIIIHLYNKKLTSLFDFIPFGAVIAESVGFPIPIYLSEQITGLFVQSESRSIDIDTEIIHDTRKDPINPTKTKKVDIKQTGLNSLLTVNIAADGNSTFVPILLALLDLIMPKVATAEYAISYLRGSTVIFQGQLHHFSSTAEMNTTKLNIDLTISTAKKFGDTPLNEQADEVTKGIDSIPINEGPLPNLS
jgi:hypothetical protein